MQVITTIGLDIAKQSFFVHAEDAAGKAVIKKALKREEVLAFFAKLPSRCLAGLEACAAAHYWSRELVKLGHDVRLIPPARVKAFVPRQKNDAADAQGICAAVRQPEMRFVPVKSVEQQSLLMLHAARDVLVGQRVQVMNAIGDEQARLPAHMLAAMRALVSALHNLNGDIAELDRAIHAALKGNELAQRLATVPGIGAFIATRLAGLYPQVENFANGRAFAASLGLVPAQRSTGGKPRLGSISKMGNRDVRRLLVVGATAILWRMRKAKRFRLVSVALANKLARIAWALIARGGTYQARTAA